jgi:lysophospholipase L1-like esterase
LYAAFVENDLGVQVNAHDRTSGGLSIATILDRLRTNSSWRSDVAENEIVILFGGPDGSKSTAHPGDWDCGNRPYHVNDCSPETFDVFREHWSGAIEEIIALRGGKSTLIIATDLYNPFISGWRADGMEDTCRRCWDNMNATIREVAAERGVTFVSCYDVLNGPNHDEDPRVKGYIGADGIHCNALGQQVIADTLRTAGYGSTIPRP